MSAKAAFRETLVGEPFLDRTIAYALERNPSLVSIDRARVSGLARKTALEMAVFEEMARAQGLHVPETAEEARKIKAIWDISFAGTYLKEFQDDRYKDKPWATWTDRRRLNYSATLMRRLTEKITGRSYNTSPGKKFTPQQLEELRSDIERFGPFLIYGSTSEQNEDLETALSEQGVVIPKNKVHIIAEKVVDTNTVDQMKTFSLPKDLQVEDGDILAVVAHAPHLVRVLHMLNRYKPLPDGMGVHPYPMAAPPAGGDNFAMQEISGILYYTFITGDSSEEIYPYKV